VYQSVPTFHTFTHLIECPLHFQGHLCISHCKLNVSVRAAPVPIPDSHIPTQQLFLQPPKFRTPMSESIMLTDVPGGVSQVEQGLHELTSLDIRSIIDTIHLPTFCRSFLPERVIHRTVMDSSV
jgi:hypothetical protein